MPRIAQLSFPAWQADGGAGRRRQGCRCTDLKASADVGRPHLDGDEHDATLGPSGWTSGLQTCG